MSISRLARQNIELDENRNRKKLFCAACSSPVFYDHTHCSNTVLPVIMSCETDRLGLQPANNFAGCHNPSFSFCCVAEWMLRADVVCVGVSVWSADQCLHPGHHQPAGPVWWSCQDLQCKSRCLLRTFWLKNFMEGCVRIYLVLWKLWFVFVCVCVDGWMLVLVHVVPLDGMEWGCACGNTSHLLRGNTCYVRPLCLHTSC